LSPTALAALGCALATAVLVYGEAHHLHLLRGLSKTLASSLMIAVAALAGAGQAGAAGAWVLVGLGLSAVGDLALLRREKPFFLGGLVAFLFGHVAYVASFAALEVSWAVVALAFALLLVPAAVVDRWLGERPGRLRPAVRAYTLVITAMVATCLGQLAFDPTPARGAVLVGALLFYLSDLTVARDRFVDAGAINKIFGLPLYYAGQVVLAASVPSVVLG
jgi:uncharacterized membrane protein YhhN